MKEIPNRTKYLIGFALEGHLLDSALTKFGGQSNQAWEIGFAGSSMNEIGLDAVIVAKNAFVISAIALSVIAANKWDRVTWKVLDRAIYYHNLFVWGVVTWNTANLYFK